MLLMVYSVVTLNPVKQFQSSNGLVVDAKVGPNTKATLCSALGSTPNQSLDANCDSALASL